MYQASEGHKQFLGLLEDQLAQKFSEKQAKDISTFACLYYASASLEELAERRSDDLYGATVSAWNFVQKHDNKEPKIRVYNPDFEQHGWQSTHTVIEVLQRDMAFLVDSVRIELNRRGLTVHSIHNAVLNFLRDDKGQMLELKGRSEGFGEGKGSAESLIYIEVDRHTDQAELDELSASLNEVLAEVSTAVEDFDHMEQKC
ncbi:NAD-glutamate dehydrogenase, partial [Oceanospirillum sp. HFRX-1_2]